MKIEVCTGDWPIAGYQTPLFKKTYTGTPDVTADTNTGDAGYTNNTAKTTLMEVALIPMMRNIYAYRIGYSISNATNGDYVEIGEYDGGNTVVWVRRFNYTGGAWDYWYSMVICEGLNVTLYNTYGDKTTVTRTKPYGRLFMRVRTTGATNAYLNCYAVYSEVTKEMITNNNWQYSAYQDTDCYLYSETKYTVGSPYYSRYNKLEYPINVEYPRPKQVISFSGVPISVNSDARIPVKVTFNTVMSDIDMAVWRKHMELPDWGNSNHIYVKNFYYKLFPDTYHAINSVEFGDEIEYGTGLYNARITATVLDYAYYAYNLSNSSIDNGYTVRSSQYRHSQNVSSNYIRNTSQEPVDMVTVKMFHLSLDDWYSVRDCCTQSYNGNIVYTPPKGSAPFGAHRGNGPFLAKIVGLRGSVVSVNRVDAELDLIYYGEA